MKNKAFDNIIEILIEREISKQSLNATVDDVFDLMKEIVIEHNNKAETEHIEEYINSLLGDSPEKYLKNPLLKINTKYVSLNYPILINFIKSRLTRYLFKERKEEKKLSSILQSGHMGEGEFYDNLVEIAEDINLENISYYIEKMIKEYKKEGIDRQEKEKIKKALSCLNHLVAQKSRELKKDLTTTLKEIYHSTENTIRNLFIYGKFPPLDLSNIVIYESYFYQYENLHKSTFPKKEKTIFLYTEFNDIEIPNSKKIHSSLFDKSCTFKKTNLREVAKKSTSAKEEKKENIAKDIQSIIKNIDNSRKSRNKLSQVINLKSKMSIDTILGSMVKHGLLEKENDLYKVHENYQNKIEPMKYGAKLPEYELIIDELNQ